MRFIQKSKYDIGYRNQSPNQKYDESQNEETK